MLSALPRLSMTADVRNIKMEIDKHSRVILAGMLLPNVIMTLWFTCIYHQLGHDYIVHGLLAYPFLILTESVKPAILIVLVWPLVVWPLFFGARVWARVLSYTALAGILFLDVVTTYVLRMAGAVT
jgi:hypothetical protein